MAQWQRVFIPRWFLAALLLCSFLIYYYFRCLCLLSAPLVRLGGWHGWTYQGKCWCIYLPGAYRCTTGWKMIPGLNSSVYSVQDLLSTVSLLCWCNFWELGQQSVLWFPLRAVWERTKSGKKNQNAVLDTDGQRPIIPQGGAGVHSWQFPLWNCDEMFECAPDICNNIIYCSASGEQWTRLPPQSTTFS